MDTMDRVDAIYQRHVAALERIGVCGDAVRLSLRLALEELEEGRGARGEATPDTKSLEQLHRIDQWLAKHADGRGEGMEIADAMIAFAEDNKLAVIRSMEYQIAAKQAEIERLTRQADRRTREIEASRAAISHASEMAAIQIPAVTVAANVSHANPPCVLPEEAVKVDAIRGSTWLRDDDLDWLEGLERGAHSFRTVPKETRRRLVQAHIDAVRTGSEAPRQFDFDQARPVWMPTAGSAAATFGVSWADLCAAKELPY